MDYEWLKSILAVIAQHGPWAVLAFYLVRRQSDTSRRDKHEQDVIAAYHTAIVENTRVTERLAALIEERTRGR